MRLVFGLFKHLLFFVAFATFSAFAQQGPSQLNISGGLFNSAGQPITSSNVRFKIDIYDKNATCLMYTEQHTGVDLSGSRGAFSLIIGAGTSAVNNLEGTTAFDSKIFENPGAVAPFTGCGSGLTLNPGDTRLIRVSYDIGGGLVAMTPDIPITSSAYAMVAETLQGKAASDFIMTNVNTSLSQTNVDYIFSNTNYPNLKALVDGTSTQYIVSNPSAAVGFNGQRLINVGTPTSGTDATNKTYVDSNLGGKTVDVTGVGPGIGGGRTIVWDQTQNKWVTSATGAVGLVAAGTGLNGGNITASGTLSVDVGTTANKILQLDASARIPAVDGSLITNVNAMFLQGRSLSIAAPAAQQVLGWNGLTSQWEPETPSGGTVTGMTGDVSGTGSGVISTTIQPNAVTSSKINNTGVAVNRLLITDATTGATVGYASCALGEVMQWTATGWACKSVALMLGTSGVTSGTYGNGTQVSQVGVDAQGRVVSLTNVNIAFPVTSVAGRTGAVTLTAADVSGLGTAAAQNVGTGVNNVLQFTTAGQLPALDGSLLTNLPLASSQWTTSGQNIYYNLGNVGIGTSSALRPLEIVSAPFGGWSSSQLRLRETSSNGWDFWAGGALLIGNNGSTAFAVNNSNIGFEITQATQASTGVAYGLEYDGTLKAVAANDALVGLTVSPTFNDNGQTGVAHYGLLVPNGNVGIGTTTPAYKLDVAGTVNASALLINGVAVGTSSSPWQINGANTYYNLGNVGIGTSSPTANLSVIGTATIGSNNTASNTNAIAMGVNSVASGTYSTAMGSGTTASNFASTAMGQLTTASGQMSTAMGYNTASPAYDETVIGQYNVTGGETPNSWVATDPLFVIGNGTGAGAKSNAVTVLKNGNVGIGTTDPTSSLEISGNEFVTGVITTVGAVTSQATNPATYSSTNSSLNAPVGVTLTLANDDNSTPSDFSGLTVGPRNTSSTYQRAYFGAIANASGTTPTIVIGEQTGPTAYSESMRIDSSGNVGIGTATPGYKLDVAGTVNATALTVNGVAVGTSSSPWQISGANTYYNLGNVGIGTPTPNGNLAIDNTGHNATLCLNGKCTSSLVSSSGGTMTGQLVGEDGLVSSPSFSFAGDTGTGIYDVSPGTIGISAGSTQAMAASSSAVTIPLATASSNASSGALVVSGGVGVGGNINVAGSISATGAFSTITAWQLQAGSSMSATYASSSNASNIPNGEDGLVIFNNSATDNVASTAIFGVKNASNNSQQATIGAVSNPGAGNYSPSLVFVQSVNNTHAYQERMRIDPSGNLGIGTTSPIGILDVRGGTAAAATNASDITLNAQAAGSGNQNGGSIDLNPGNPTGTGSPGSVNVNVSKLSSGTTANATGLALSLTNNSGSTITTSNGISSSVLSVNANSNLTTTAAVYGSVSSSQANVGTAYGGQFVAGGGLSTIPVFTNAYGVQGAAAVGPGNAINAYGGEFEVTKGGGTISNGYGVYIGPVQATTAYSLYSSSTANSYFAGNVGIGTTTPGYKLDVAGTVNASALLINGVAVGTSSSPWQVNGSNTYYNLGNVGIGTSSPIDIFQVQGAGGGMWFQGANGILWTRQINAQNASVNSSEAGDNTVYTSTSSSVSAPSAYQYITATNQSGSADGLIATMQLVTSNSSGKLQSAYLGAVSNAGASTYNPSIVIGQQTGATAYAERLRIDSSGNVGIGTATPGYKLDVAGTVNASALMVNGVAVGTSSSPWQVSASNTYYNLGNVGIGTTSPADKLDVAGSAMFRPGGIGGTVELTTPFGDTGFVFSNTNRADIRFDNSSLKLVAGTGAGTPSATSGLAISTSGNVGIGTTTPNGLLDVEGGIAAAGAGRGIILSAQNGFLGSNGGSITLLSGYGGSSLAPGGDLNLSAGLGSNGGNVFITSGAGTIKGGNIVLTAGNGPTPGSVGIGTSTPQALLDIQATASGQSAILLPRDTTANRPPAGVNGMIRYNTNTASFEGFSNGAWSSLASGAGSQWTTSGSNINYTSGNVGIGTATPGAKLDIAGTVRIADGTQSAGYVLTSDASGNASWASATPANSASTTYFVRAASSADLTLSGTQTVDGVALAVGDRVLLKNNAFAANGVYVVAAGAWSRASDLSTWSQAVGYRVHVQSGTYFGGMDYVSNAQPGGTLGSTALNFVAMGSGDTTNSVAVGVQALNSQAAPYNSAVGAQALKNLTSGQGNTAIGYMAALNQTTGNFNTSLGHQSLNQTTTGGSNVAIGNNALNSNVANSSNTAIGSYAMYYANSTAAGSNTYNVALGYQALQGPNPASGNTGKQNTALGANALLIDSTGSNNIAIGYNSGSAITTGSNNVIIGENTGSSIATLSNYILLSDGAGNQRVTINNSGNVGVGTATPNYKLDVAGSINASSVLVNGVAIGTTSTQWTTSGSSVYYNLGNVGIGTTTPGTTLDVAGTARFGGQAYGVGIANGDTTPSTQVAQMTMGTANTLGYDWIQTWGGKVLALNLNGNNVSLVAGNGSVGIGTLTPTAVLDVENPLTTVQIKSTVGTFASTLKIVNTTQTNIGNEGSAGGALVPSSLPYATVINNQTAALQLGTNNAVRLTIDSTGNVGIGTATPRAALDIVNTTSGMSAIVIPADTTANRPPTGVNGMIRYNTNSNAFEGFANGAWGALASGGGSSQWTTSGTDIYYNIGNVGIGTSTPSSTLTVAGTIQSTSGGIKFPDNSTQTTAYGPSNQSWAAHGTFTWTKPSSGTMALIECWGAGGGGISNTGASAMGGGGGGGGYVMAMIPVSSLGATETVTIGTGGLKGSNTTAGLNGGNSSFGTWVTGYGGGGAGTVAGGGGGSLGAGSDNTAGDPDGGGPTQIDAVNGGGGGEPPGWVGMGSTGGKSLNGGAGGGACNNSVPGVDLGGVSKRGGAGGAGSTTGAAGNGSSPGGGGGGSCTGTAGDGADGKCQITVW